MKSFLAYLIIVFSIQTTFSQEDGVFKEYYESGKLETEGKYYNGKRIGVWKTYHENGKLKSLSQYHNGKLLGEVKRFYDNGQLSSIELFDFGKRKPESKSFYETGVLRSITERKEENYITKGYFESSNLKYEREYKSGYYKEFLEDGTLLIEANYKNNELLGVWKQYYRNGNVQWEVNYNGGYREGEYKNFYENGQLKLEGNMVNDKNDGEEKRYLNNGNLLLKGSYKNGKLDKTWISYDNEKNKKTIVKFKNGKVISSKTDIEIEPTIVPDAVKEKVPIYPGCEKVYGNSTRKKCMSEKIQFLVKKKFNTNLSRNLGLNGIQRISVVFKIDKTGNIKDIEVRAPHKVLEKEAIRVAKLIPEVKPGIQNGKTVTIQYSLPIIFQVR